jgi:hypothetical protein
MQTIIFSFLAIVIVLGGLWYHDVRHPPEEQARETKRNQRAIKDGTADASKEQLVGAHIHDKEVALTTHAGTTGQD